MRRPVVAIAALAVTGFIVIACGGSAPPPSAASSKVQASAPIAFTPPKGALWRQDVLAEVARPGYFLQRVEVEPELRDGQFHGFRIVDLRPAQWWSGVDLKPGDVILALNGVSIERPTDLHRAGQVIQGADQLTVDYVRAGQQRTLKYRILDAPSRRAKLKQAPER